MGITLKIGLTKQAVISSPNTSEIHPKLSFLSTIFEETTHGPKIVRKNKLLKHRRKKSYFKGTKFEGKNRKMYLRRNIIRKFDLSQIFTVLPVE
jgi:hypothetical protein